MSTAVPASAFARDVANLNVSDVSTIAQYVVAALSPAGSALDVLTWTGSPVVSLCPTAVQMSVAAAANTVSAMPCAHHAAVELVRWYMARPGAWAVSRPEVSAA